MTKHWKGRKVHFGTRLGRKPPRLQPWRLGASRAASCKASVVRPPCVFAFRPADGRGRCAREGRDRMVRCHRVSRLPAPGFTHFRRSHSRLRGDPMAPIASGGRERHLLRDTACSRVGARGVAMIDDDCADAAEGEEQGMERFFSLPRAGPRGVDKWLMTARLALFCAHRCRWTDRQPSSEGRDASKSIYVWRGCWREQGGTAGVVAGVGNPDCSLELQRLIADYSYLVPYRTFCYWVNLVPYPTSAVRLMRDEAHEMMKLIDVPYAC